MQKDDGASEIIDSKITSKNVMKKKKGFMMVKIHLEVENGY